MTSVEDRAEAWLEATDWEDTPDSELLPPPPAVAPTAPATPPAPVEAPSDDDASSKLFSVGLGLVFALLQAAWLFLLYQLVFR